MGSEEIVRERYPHAESRHYDAVHQIGQKAATQPEYWAIYPAGGLGNQPIATGPTEEAAWTLAAEKVLEGLREPQGLRIKREMLDDIGKPGAGVAPLEEVDAALEREEEVIVDEPDGSESILERGDEGGYRTRPRM